MPMSVKFTLYDAINLKWRRVIELIEGFVLQNCLNTYFNSFLLVVSVFVNLNASSNDAFGKINDAELLNRFKIGMLLLYQRVGIFDARDRMHVK